MTCKYYDEKMCSETCKDDWVKCSLCKEYIEPYDEDFDKTNGHIIMSAFLSCDGIDEQEDYEKTICNKCYKKIFKKEGK